MPSTYYSDFPPITTQPRYGEPNPSLAPTNRTVKATKQKIHSYSNAHKQYLQEKIPPNKPYIGLRTAYRPGYAMCVILAGIINLLSGIITTAISWAAPTNNTEPYRVLRVLGPIILVLGIIFLTCGLVLLFHYRRGRRKEKEAIERGHPYEVPPRSRKRPRQDDFRKDVRRPPQGSAALRGPTSGMSDYSYYEEQSTTSKRTPRLPRGDWKYVSEVRDVTYEPRPPREERRSDIYGTEMSVRHTPYRITGTPATEYDARSSQRTKTEEQDKVARRQRSTERGEENRRSQSEYRRSGVEKY